MAPPTSLTMSHPHPVQAPDSPKLGWSPQVRPHEEWRTLASPKGEPEPAPEKPPPAPAVWLALVLEEDDEEEEKPAVRKPHPPSHPPQSTLPHSPQPLQPEQSQPVHGWQHTSVSSQHPRQHEQQSSWPVPFTLPPPPPPSGRSRCERHASRPEPTVAPTL